VLRLSPPKIQTFQFAASAPYVPEDETEWQDDLIELLRDADMEAFRTLLPAEHRRRLHALPFKWDNGSTLALVVPPDQFEVAS